MAKEVEVADSAGEVVSQLETVAVAFENGLAARLSNMGKAGADWDAFQTVLGTHQLTVWSLALIGIGAFFVALLLSHAGLYLIERRAARAAGWRRGLGLLAASLLALVIMMLLTRLAVNDETIRTVVRFWVLAGLIFLLTRAGLIFVIKAHQSDDPAASAAAVKAFSANLAFAVLWALVGIALSMALRVLGAGPGLLDLGRTALTFVLLLLLVSAYWRFRNTVRAVIVSPHPDSVFLRKLAAMWPWIAILFTILTVVGSQAATTIGKPLPPLATFITLLLVLLAPHLDTVAAAWAERGLESPEVTVLSVAWRRTFRFLVLVAIFSLLSYFWVAPVLIAVGLEPATIAAHVAEVGLIILFSAFLWNAIGAFALRVAKADANVLVGEGDGETPNEEPRSRLSTILPLIVWTSKAAILSMGVLSVMSAVGINVLPIIGGLSVFGLAIGFGSQTLVKDIVAGLFFLTDDAFRFGEYIETSGSKGTVEKISIRSVSLRNPRGPIAVVPYGQIGKVTNFSRGWVIEKYIFRVAFDTDVDLVRKLFKKIGQDIAANPEFAADLLEPFKSQGIGMVEDGTLVLRGKFKARAGHQFGIKKAVMAAVQKAFTENGIKAIPKPFE